MRSTFFSRSVTAVVVMLTAFGSLSTCGIARGQEKAQPPGERKQRPTIAPKGFVELEKRTHHVQPTVVGTGADRRIGVPEPSLAFADQVPLFTVAPSLASVGELSITRMFYCRQDHVSTGPRTARDRRVDLWTPVPDGPHAQLVQDSSDPNLPRFRPTRGLQDGVYCLHTGTLSDPDKLPSLCVPFVVRGIGQPKVEASSVKVEGKRVTLELVIRNVGDGDFDDGLLVATLQKKEGNRGVFKDRQNKEVGLIPAGGQITFRSVWDAGNWPSGQYYFFGHINYRYLYDANALCDVSSDTFTID